MTDQRRHPKMVAAAEHLARKGYDISKMPVTLGKGGKFRWKDYATHEPSAIGTLLGGAVNSVVIPRGQTVVIDADTPDSYTFLSSAMPPGLRVNSPTAGHGHFYGWYPEPKTLPDVYEGGEVRRDPGGKDAPGGAGGMVIGPWSMTSAGVYVLADGPRDIPQVPEPVAQWLRERAGRTPPIALTNGHAPNEPILINVEGYKLPERVGEGGRYPALARYTAHLYNRGLSVVEMWPLVETQLAPRFDKPYDGSDGRTLRTEFEKAVEHIDQRLGERASDRIPVVARTVTQEELDALRESASELVWVGDAVPSPDANAWLIEDLMKPRGIGVLAATEGVGKSWVAREAALRLATGTGSLFGKYAIVRPTSVLLFDEDNGPDTEYEYEEELLSALNLSRSQLGFRYGRYSFVGTHLVSDDDRDRFVARLLAWRDNVPPNESAVVIIDTGGAVVDDEFGPSFKKVMQFISRVAVEHNLFIWFVVHMVKPPRDGKMRATGSMPEVMGWWPKRADVVMTMLPDDSDPTRAHWRVSKRYGTSGYVLAQQDGLWVAVAESKAARHVVLRATDRNILEALNHQPRKVDGPDGVMEGWLDKMADPPTRRTVFRRLGAMLDLGLVTKDGAGVWSVTESGKASMNLPVRLELGVEPEGHK